MKVKITAMIALSILIAACGESQDKAVGLYKYKNQYTGTEKIAEVKKDGDAYLFIENVLQNGNAIALTNSDDGLSYRSMQLKISEDGNTIYFGPINGTRISADEFKSKLDAIESNKKACNELREEVIANDKTMKNEEWNSYVKSLSDKMPNDCRIAEASRRW